MEREDSGFLPHPCRVRAFLAVVAVSLVLALVAALASGGSLAELWHRFNLIALYVLLIALGWAALLCPVRKALNRQRPLVAGLLAWVALLVVALEVTLLAAWLIPLREVAGISGPELLVRTLGIGAILGALILRYLYELHRQRSRELAEGRARYQALQARIRPHFLFNSLNTVVSLVGSRPERAQAVLLDLADLFRASLGRDKQPSTLEQELQLVRQYLGVEKLRLGERLRVEWDLDDLPLETPVPPLLLQPLVENAVYHGIEPAPEGGTITIYGRGRPDRVVLTVANTFVGPAREPEREGHGMALDNVRQRLAVFFDDQAGLQTTMVDGWYKVRIWFKPRPPEAPR